MNRALILLLALGVLVGSLFAAGEVTYTCGNLEPVSGQFNKFYADTIRIKAGATWLKDTLWTTITVPGDKTAFNLKMWMLDPSTREESLQVVVKFNNFYSITTTVDVDSGEVWPVSDFGIDNKADTLYYNASFSTIDLKCYTSTAGADAADSIAHIYLQFVTDKGR